MKTTWTKLKYQWHGHRRTLVFLFILALGVHSGCGLADYEARMDARLKQVQMSDKMQTLLGPPLLLPVSRDAKSDQPLITLLNVFIRPPREIAGTTAPAGPYGRQVKLYHYGGEKEMGLILGSNDLSVSFKNQADFIAGLETALSEFLASVYRARVQVKLATPQVVDATTGGTTSKPILHTSWQADKQSGLPIWMEVYLVEEAGNWITVVYILPASGGPNEIIQYSIRSLALGEDGVQARAIYQRAESSK